MVFKIQTTKEVETGNDVIPQGEILKVKSKRIFGFVVCEVIDGERYSGCLIPEEYCIRVPNVKTYTEKEWKDTEGYLIARIRKAEKQVEQLQKELERYKPKEDPLANKIDQLIGEWIKAPYIGDEQTDRKIFSINLADIVRKELTQQT